MKQSLRTKLAISYVSIIFVCVSLISFLSNIFLEKQFRDYIIDKQEEKNQEILSLITDQYRDEKEWNVSYLERIGMHALENGLIIKIKDIENEIVWDATVHNDGMCKDMLHNMGQNMLSRYSNFEGGYEEKRYELKYNFDKIGTMDVGYYGPYYYSDKELSFINTINKLLLWGGIISLIFALLLSTFFSKRISIPITEVIKKAHNLSQGDYDERIVQNSSTKEISILINTVNNLAETLKQQEYLRKRLTQDVAHELRTPLTSIQGNIEAMVDGIWDMDKERLQGCYDEVLRIIRLVGDLEKLSEYDREDLKLNKKRINISELIQRIISNFENQFNKKNIHINFLGHEIELFADEDKISQAFINIISNTLKYTQENGTVDIQVKEQNNKIIISFKDNGIGIASEDLPHIFERFYRTEKSRSRLTGGTGIGLTIVKSIIKAHKGEIIVKSEKEKGSEFIIIFKK